MKDEKKINSEEMKRHWHAQQEDILKDWSEQSSCYRWMHERAYQDYNKKSMYYAIPVIIISTITGTANFAQGSFPDGAKVWAPLIIGALNLSAGLITTISQFLRVSELLEGHRAASLAYSKLSRNIAVELSLPADERSMKGIEYIKQCRSDIDRLIEQSPPIPPEILNAFGKSILNISKKNPEGNDPEFSVPSILKLEPINVFRTEKDEAERKVKILEMKQKEKEYKSKILKEENDRIQKAIQEHENKRNSIINNYDLENQLKMLKKHEQEKKDMEMKKQNLSISSITKKMMKFKNILTEEDSSSDDDKNNIGININDTYDNLNSLEEGRENSKIDGNSILNDDSKKLKNTIIKDISNNFQDIIIKDTLNNIQETIIQQDISNNLQDISNNAN